MLTELKKAAQILDQRMRQHVAEKASESLHPTNQTTSKNSDAMEVDATHQQQLGKEVRNQKTYLAFMKGKWEMLWVQKHGPHKGKQEPRTRHLQPLQKSGSSFPSLPKQIFGETCCH